MLAEWHSTFVCKTAKYTVAHPFLLLLFQSSFLTTMNYQDYVDTHFTSYSYRIVFVLFRGNIILNDKYSYVDYVVFEC